MGKQGSWVGMLPEEWRWALRVWVLLEEWRWAHGCVWVFSEEWRWAHGYVCGCFLRNGGGHMVMYVGVFWGMEVGTWLCMWVFSEERRWAHGYVCGCFLRKGGGHMVMYVGVFWGKEVGTWLCVGVFWGKEVGTWLCMWVLLEEWRRALGFGVLPEKLRCGWVVFEICIPGEGGVCDVIGGLVTCKIQGKYSSGGRGGSGRRPWSVLRPDANVNVPVSVAAATRRMRVEERNRMVSARRPMITTLSTSRVRKSLKRKKMKQ